MTARKELPLLRIVHLSDLHFGKKHICQPPDPSGSYAGVPNLEELLLKDLKNDSWAYDLWATPKDKSSDSKVVVAITGDITQEANNLEYTRAYEFLSAFKGKKILNNTLTPESLFVVPGNHDVDFKEEEIEHRFASYCAFYNKVYSKYRNFLQPHEAESLTQVHVNDDQRLCMIEINSCLYVEKETIDESRGQIDLKTIAELRKKLNNLKGKVKKYLKIAILHHHPILIPSFVEPGRGYDAALNSGSLLRLLREEGVHLILHGHKHYPQVFSYDPESAWAGEIVNPQLVIAGGSCGSSELPAGRRSSNCYNLITLKWDPEANYTRVHVITRGLERTSHEGHVDPDLWRWKTVRVFDKILGPFSVPNKPLNSTRKIRSDKKTKSHDDIIRSDHYSRLRYNMPVVEILPSLLPGQAYEGRVWLEPHGRKHKESPVKVTWSAGTWFDRKVCEVATSPCFATNFHYWGPMLIQAEMEFSDGSKEYGQVYARLP